MINLLATPFKTVRAYPWPTYSTYNTSGLFTQKPRTPSQPTTPSTTRKAHFRYKSIRQDCSIKYARKSTISVSRHSLVTIWCYNGMWTTLSGAPPIQTLRSVFLSKGSLRLKHRRMHMEIGPLQFRQSLPAAPDRVVHIPL